MALVPQGAVALVADLKPVLVILAGAVGGTGHIAKLNFVDPLFRLYGHRKADL